jgi:hypothetical protein
VEPQIIVPMDEATQRKVFVDRSEAENFRRPVPKATSRPSTQPTTGTPTTQPVVDGQLQRAVDTMIGLIVLQGNREGLVEAGEPLSPVTAMRDAPTTAPGTVSPRQ